MSIYNIVLFFHVIGAIGYFLGIGIWLFILLGLRRTQRVEQVRSLIHLNDLSAPFAAASAVLHAVQGAIGGGEQLFRSVAVFGKAGRACAGGNHRGFKITRHFFVNAVDDACGDIRIGFGKNDGKFISAIARSRVNRAAMIAENFPEAHKRAAAR